MTTLPIYNQEIKLNDYPFSLPNKDGPEYKKYVYHCSAIPPVVVKLVPDSEYKKYKTLDCSPFINVFNEFYMNRKFSSFTYAPIFLSLISSKNLSVVTNFINKYLYSFKKSTDKVLFDLDNLNINFELFDKDTSYVVSLSKSFKDFSNLYIDEELPD